MTWMISPCLITSSKTSYISMEDNSKRSLLISWAPTNPSSLQGRGGALFTAPIVPMRDKNSFIREMAGLSGTSALGNTFPT